MLEPDSIVSYEVLNVFGKKYFCLKYSIYHLKIIVTIITIITT